MKMDVATETAFEIRESDDGEMFRFLSVVFDVGKAKKLLRARKKKPKPGRIEVRKLEPIISVRKKDPSGKLTGLTLGVSVDWDRIERDARSELLGEAREGEEAIDVAVPIILAYLEEDGTMIPIDGYHRIGKAILKGLETLPFFLLTKAESEKARIR